jgi:hypothetical protein
MFQWASVPQFVYDIVCYWWNFMITNIQFAMLSSSNSSSLLSRSTHLMLAIHQDFHTQMWHNKPNRTAQRSIAQHSTAKHSTVGTRQHSTAKNSTGQHIAQHSTAQHSQAQHSWAQLSAAQYIAQPSQAQHSTAQHSKKPSTKSQALAQLLEFNVHSIYWVFITLSM